MRTARFEVYEAKDGWRWRLLAANNRQIAQGEAHTRERDAYRACEAVKLACRIASSPAFVSPVNLDPKSARKFAKQWVKAGGRVTAVRFP